MIDVQRRIGRFVFPTLIAVVVVPLALGLLIIGARSPFTHVNLDEGFISSYMRTDQALVGSPELYQGGKLVVPLASDPVERGRQLYVSKGCASCHGLEGRDAIVGPVIVGTSVKALRQKTQKGPGGMPAYAPDALSDDDLNAIAAYLKAMGK
jgi:mono/diheme cytochrome c family protein